MPRPNSYVFEVALSWTTMHERAADSSRLNRHSETLSRDQRFRRFGGTWNSAGVVTVPQICVTVKL